MPFTEYSGGGSYSGGGGGPMPAPELGAPAPFSTTGEPVPGTEPPPLPWVAELDRPKFNCASEDAC